MHAHTEAGRQAGVWEGRRDGGWLRMISLSNLADGWERGGAARAREGERERERRGGVARKGEREGVARVARAREGEREREREERVARAREEGRESSESERGRERESSESEGGREAERERESLAAIGALDRIQPLSRNWSQRCVAREFRVRSRDAWGSFGKVFLLLFFNTFCLGVGVG